MAATLANPEMIKAYQSGVPGNGKPFPDGPKLAKIHWNSQEIGDVSRGDSARRPDKRRFHGEGQQEVR